MSWEHLSGIALGIALALANHIWQSTVIALVAALLAFALRKNQAHVRYRLWLAASLKFLVPVSLLITLGSHFPWPQAPARRPVGFYHAIEQVSQPFPELSIIRASQVAQNTVADPSLGAHESSLVLAAIWFSGFVLVLFVWYVRWRQVCEVVRNAAILRGGREVEMLRRVGDSEGVRKPIEIRLSRAPLEPGIVGIGRPVLVWPAGISECLDDAQLEAVLAHEVCHVRRRDNLAAVVHMFVEAVFWFHPLVWWLGARLVDERERACDEAVLQSGSHPRVYAESILKTCEFCVESPLSCVSGIAGTDLKRRIQSIMTNNRKQGLDFGKKATLIVIGLSVVCGPLAIGVMRAAQNDKATTVEVQESSGGNSGLTNETVPSTQAQPTSEQMQKSINDNRPSNDERTQPGPEQAQEWIKFPFRRANEFVSIKQTRPGGELFRMMFEQNGLSANGVTLRQLVQIAYGVRDTQILAIPSWISSEKYDLEVRMDDSTVDALRRTGEDQVKAQTRRMLQGVLADRFKLKLHRESRQIVAYVLVVGENGSKLHEATPGDTYPNGFKGPDGGSGAGMFFLGRYEGGKAELKGQGLTMATLTRLLSEEVIHETVLDNTGLAGTYDFTLQWQTREAPGAQATESFSPSQLAGPSVLTAIQEQLGLKLEVQKGSGFVLVIDDVERPSEN